MDALGEISQISQKQDISDKDLQKVLQAVKQIEQLLS